MKSLSVKLAILYIFLLIINISFFTILIHENQVDLITKVKKYESLELASDITAEINSLVSEINNNPDRYPDNTVIKDKIIEKFIATLPDIDFILFSIDGKVIYELSPDTFPFNNAYTIEAQKAVTRSEFSNKAYTASFLNDNEIHFYVPLDLITDIILLFRLDISDIHDKLATIYRMIFIFIVLITLFHILFGVILHRIVVSPINVLAKKSDEISKGNYKTRVDLKRTDEFGILTNAFNHMVQSIQEKIDSLDRMNKRMKLELQMAGEVQKSIYPVIKKTKYLNFAIHHKPLIEVSGDYHDIFEIGDEIYGCIVADVSGHGVSAALITMLIKEKCEEIVATYMDTKDFIKAVNSFFGDLMQRFDKFFTAFYIIIDGKKKTITFTNAGQSSAFLVRGKELISLNTGGIIIGFAKNLN